MKLTRRQFLCGAASVAAALPFLRTSSRVADPPIRAITNRPAYHWFGYYDKLQFGPQDRYVLGMETDFEGRSPTPEDVIGVGMVDTQTGDRWIEFGQSRAWGWQQGCMLQWRPPDTYEVIWNDRQNNRYVSHLLNVKTWQRRTLPRPIYALSPDGRVAIGTDFARIDYMRPGYGYEGVEDPNRDTKAPRDAGIYRMDLESGDNELILSYSEVAEVPHLGQDVSGKWHYFNHLLVNPDGTRFLFLNRYKDQVEGRYTTRMFTADMDGSELYEIDPGDTSHIIWRDPRHILAWTGDAGREHGYYLFEDQTGDVEPYGQDKMTHNGHQTYLPAHDNEWVLNDGYPGDDRKQPLYLYHVPSGRRVDLGEFYSPPSYDGEWRVDLHPRASRDGTKVCIDSAHGGNGRQLYLIDISDIVA